VTDDEQRLIEEARQDMEARLTPDVRKLMDRIELATGAYKVVMDRLCNAEQQLADTRQRRDYWESLCKNAQMRLNEELGWKDIANTHVRDLKSAMEEIDRLRQEIQEGWDAETVKRQVADFNRLGDAARNWKESFLQERERHKDALRESLARGLEIMKLQEANRALAAEKKELEIAASNDGQCACRWKLLPGGGLGEQIEECSYHINLRGLSAQRLAEVVKLWQEIDRLRAEIKEGWDWKEKCIRLRAEVERITAQDTAIAEELADLQSTYAKEIRLRIAAEDKFSVAMAELRALGADVLKAEAHARESQVACNNQRDIANQERAESAKLRQEVERAEAERDGLANDQPQAKYLRERDLRAKAEEMNTNLLKEVERLSSYEKTHLGNLGDLRAEIKRLREGLQWYADGKHYWLNGYHEPSIKDLGEHAKVALMHPCNSCGEHHPPGTMCPPHEVRQGTRNTTPPQRFLEQVLQGRAWTRALTEDEIVQLAGSKDPNVKEESEGPVRCTWCGAREESHTDIRDGVRGHEIRDVAGLNGVWHAFTTDPVTLKEKP